ncbi:Protein CBG09438, partial [Caenorhabditis briggsae]
KLYLINAFVQAILFFRQMIIIVPDDCYFKMDLIQLMRGNNLYSIHFLE